MAMQTSRPKEPTAPPLSEESTRPIARPFSHSTAHKQGPLPLVVGITGHRDLRLEDEPPLEACVEAFFRQFQARYPQTPLVLLSPLAEGADRLAARVALRVGVRLIVPLPMPLDAYVRDFDEASRSEFNALLEQAEEWFALPLLSGNGLDNICDQNEHRATQYALVGAYIVQHCQLLIALWNGVDSTQCGGTAEVVTFQRQGIPLYYQKALYRSHLSPRSYLDPIETGPVYHIVTPRRNSPEINGEPFACRIDTPQGIAEDVESASTYRQIFTNVETFNGDALQLAQTPVLEAKRRENAGYLLPDKEAENLSPILTRLRDAYSLADTLAQQYQKLTFQAMRWLGALSFVALLIFELTAKLTPNNGWLALLSPLLLAVTYLVYHVTVQRGKWQDRYQDYRALAEGLRVQFFWQLAGLPNSVADQYLRKVRSELDWIRLAIRNTLGETGVLPAASPTGETLALSAVQEIPLAAARTVVEANGSGNGQSAGQPASLAISNSDGVKLAWEHWVENQGHYFARAARRNETDSERFERWVQSLVTASPIVALLTALTLVVYEPLTEWMHHHEIAHKLLIIVVFVLAGVAGVLHTYADKRALSQHAKQYERMSSLFERALHHMETVKKNGIAEWHAEARVILLELGAEALAENGDWVLTHRERPVDVPHAG